MFNSSRFSPFAALFCAVVALGSAANASSVAVQAQIAATTQEATRQATVSQLINSVAATSAKLATTKVELAQTEAEKRFAESEVRRVKNNSERLLKMYPVQAHSVAAIIRDLEFHKDKNGNLYRPQIDAQVYRSASQQAALVKAGNSTVYYSFHNVTGKNGKPESLAADVVDAAKQWNVEQPFWLKLNSSALAHGSTTGIAWGLSTANRQRLALAIATKEWNYSGELGWDTAHTEPRSLTIGQAKAGQRPK